jgi:TatD DNase family protein
MLRDPAARRCPAWGRARFAGFAHRHGGVSGTRLIVRLIDSHGHLQADAFASDADEVIAAARLAGVERILAPGWDPSSSAASIALARRHELVDASVGVHPHVAAEVDDDAWASLVALASDPAVVAIGETGLDYDRGFSPRPAQLANLRRNLRLALETGKPAILHCRSRPGERDAQDELITELRAAGVGGTTWHAAFGDRPPALLHSYSGPVDYGEAALEMGLAVSFSGLVFRAGEEASAVVAHLVPDDRVLVETDSPYLSPPGAPRRRNEPLWVEVTARWLAEWRKVSPDGLGERLVANYDAIFRSRPPVGGSTP